MENNTQLQPLIDGDLLVYEISILGEFKEKGSEEVQIRHFSYLEEILVNRIEEICRAVGTKTPPIIYLTGKDNFRYKIAKKVAYKSNRKKDKPYHFYNVREFLLSRYNATVVHGIEADDAMAIHQSSMSDTVICSRDKDLKQVPGWHYGWEVGEQPEYKLKWVNPLGMLYSQWESGISEKTGKETLSLKKVTGDGLRWFYYQTLVGDPTDTIPGLPGCGPKRALTLLEFCETEKEMYEAVSEEYKIVYGDSWKEEMLEQARLVWMVRTYNLDLTPKMWEIPDQWGNLNGCS